MSTFDNQDEGLENEERQEGIIADQGEVLSLELTDEKIADIIGSRVEDAEKWWEKELGLDSARKEGERYYLNKTYKDDELDDFQTPYKNNRILTAVETLVPMITSQPAEPIVTEAKDTDESRQLALDGGNVLLSLYEDLNIKAKLGVIARHLMIGKRVGVLKYRYEPNKGRLRADGTREGKICADVVRPEKIVFEVEASDPNDISLVAEYLTTTIEKLVIKFPKKKDEIYKKYGINDKSTNKQLQKIVKYLEVWFTYYDKEGNSQEAVAWKLDKIILDAIQNPNWNYDEYETDEEGNMVNLNFFEFPQKPYIIFNHLNLGKYIIDDTSLAEQAKYLQDVLNKRGRQIVDNADQAEGGKVLNSNMISPDDAAKIRGDHRETIMVDGDVRAAATRLQVAQLPAYVLQDKFDARDEIDNIFGANAPIRGESSGVKTLGQEIISQRANMGRLQAISDSIEDGMTRFYQAMMQMMKVYWDDTTLIRFQNSEGQTRFINWNRGKIEDGIQVRVKAGSGLPKDKQAIRNETVQMAPMLDPLSIAEGLDKPNPKEWAKRQVYYKFFMDKYVDEILDGGFDGTDSKALGNIQSILNDREVEVPDDPKQAYMATLQMFVESDGFKQLEPDMQMKVMQFSQQVADVAKQGIGESPAEETAPTEQAPGEQLPAEAAGTPPPDDGNFLTRGIKSVVNTVRGV